MTINNTMMLILVLRIHELTCLCLVNLRNIVYEPLHHAYMFCGATIIGMVLLEPATAYTLNKNLLLNDSSFYNFG